MPYVSLAQERFFHSPGAKKAGITAKDVKHWDKASKGKKLPPKKGWVATADGMMKTKPK